MEFAKQDLWDIENFFSSVEENIRILLKRTEKEREPYATYQVHQAMCAGNVRLYSYTDPLQETAPKDSLEQHFSPRLLKMRLRHAKQKDVFYFDGNGKLYRPAIQIHLSEICDAYKLSHALFPLTIEGFCLPWYWRIMIRAWSRIVTFNRWMSGEKILCHFCAKDKTYFGSVCIVNSQHFINAHCKDMSSLLRAVKDFQILVMADYQT